LPAELKRGGKKGPAERLERSTEGGGSVGERKGGRGGCTYALGPGPGCCSSSSQQSPTTTASSSIFMLLCLHACVCVGRGRLAASLCVLVIRSQYYYLCRRLVFCLLPVRCAGALCRYVRERVRLYWGHRPAFSCEASAVADRGPHRELNPTSCHQEV